MIHPVQTRYITSFAWESVSVKLRRYDVTKSGQGSHERLCGEGTTAINIKHSDTDQHTTRHLQHHHLTPLDLFTYQTWLHSTPTRSAPSIKHANFSSPSILP